MSSIPEQIGNYRLIEEIGHGASSEVWLAEHKDLELHRVAIKILMSQDREAIQRFNREAALASRLRHPHIVRVYDYGYARPYYYTILEYIAGGSLKQMLANQARLPLAQALTIFKQIAAALDYAHSLNIVHRDISPGNVLVEQATAQALLTDFGIAREPGRSITTTNAIMGTPDYWSPEHTQSATAVTRLSDIYSLGVVLYRMLCGRLPFAANDEAKPTERAFAPPMPIREAGVKDLPLDIDRIFQTLMALDPSKRYSTAGAAAADLERLFERHHSDTVVNAAYQVARTAGDFETSGVETNPVDTYLGPDLIKPPLLRARQRAEQLRNPAAIARVLDDWARQDRFGLRLPMLGRLARLHKSTSHNVHFYTLRVLYERRSPVEDSEEPDRKAQSLPIERELGRWDVSLPEPTLFEDDNGGRVTLPGSARVVSCSTCKGQGTTICPRCNGRQRIYITRPLAAPPSPPPGSPNGSPTTGPRHPNSTTVSTSGAAGGVATRSINPARTGLPAAPGPTPAPTPVERVLVPCPACSGRGGVTCTRCEGVGRMIQRKIFNWQRTAATLRGNDDLPNVDELWLRQACKPEVIYAERHRNGIRAEWAQVPVLAELLETARAATDEQTRIVLSEVTISFIPLTEIVFDLGENRKGDPYLIRLPIYGFDNLIHTDWRLLDWERVSSITIVTFTLLVALILAIAAFL